MSDNLPEVNRHPVEVLKATMTRRSEDFKQVLPAHISFEKFQRTLATAALSNPKLFECDRQSLLMAAMKCAQDGLLPDGREAALVPFQKREKGADGRWHATWLVQYLPMVYGQRKKILQSGEVLSLQVGVVYAAEVASGNFVYEIGIDPPIRHRPKLDMTEAEMADNNLVAAYSIARLKNPDGEPFWSVEVMRRFEVLKVRQTSQTGALGRTDRNGNPIEPKGPWAEWEPEMWKKTVLKRHSKVLPMSGDLLDEILREEEEDLRSTGIDKALQTTERTVALPSSEEFDEETGEVTAPALDDQSGTEAGVPLDAGNDLSDGQRAAAPQTTAKTSDPAPEAQTAPAASRSDPPVDPGTGMTEVDEDAARALDAGDAGDDGWNQDDSAAEPPIDDAPAWKPTVDALIKSIADATGKASWEVAEREFLRIAGGLPDEVADDLEKRLNDKRRELQGSR